MNINEVRGLPVEERFLYWIKERESIRKKKEGELARPWTDDEILHTYRFCNVRRMDDKVSKWLQNNWYTPYKDNYNMLYGVAIARFINLPKTLKQIESDIFKTNYINYEKLVEKIRNIKKKQGVIFNAAYVVRGNDGADKIESVIIANVKPLQTKRVFIDTSSMYYTWKELCNCFGFGSFMAGQVTADLRHALTGEWKDKLSWAPEGPGSQRGLQRLKKQPINAINRHWLKDFRSIILNGLALNLPQEITGRLEAHDYQNCLCEFDKYERMLHGQGRPKQKYKRDK